MKTDIELGTPLQAIEFAIKEGYEAAIFLEAWSEGDLSEWPEYLEFCKGGATNDAR